MAAANPSFNDGPGTRYPAKPKSWHMSDKQRLRMMRMDLQILREAAEYLNVEFDYELNSTADMLLIMAHLNELKEGMSEVRDRIRAHKAGLL